jgi:hypothetical protein
MLMNEEAAFTASSRPCMISIVAAVVAIKPVASYCSANFVKLLLCADKRCHVSIASGVTIMAALIIAYVLFPCDSKF